MPLFVFVSGYFSKDVDKARSNAFNTLLVPYILFNTTMVLVAHAAGRCELSLLTPVFVHWYLLALFFWRIFLKDLVRIRFVLFLSVVSAFVIGFFWEATNLLALGRIITFLPFFLVGYYTSQEKISSLRRIPKAFAWAILVLAIWPVYYLTTSGAFSLPVVIAAPYWSVGSIYARLVFFLMHNQTMVLADQILADQTLFLAGTSNLGNSSDEAYAALGGTKGAKIAAVSTVDGSKLTEVPLRTRLVLDGMAAASGKLYLSLTDDTVQCLDGK